MGKGGTVSTALEQVYHRYAPGRCRPKDGLTLTERYWIGLEDLARWQGIRLAQCPQHLYKSLINGAPGKVALKTLSFYRIWQSTQDRLPGPMDQPLNWSLKVATATTAFCRSFFSVINVDVLQSLCFMYVVSVLLLIDLRTCAFGIFDCCP